MVACCTRERDAKKRQQRESERAPLSSFFSFSFALAAAAHLVLRVELLVDVLVHERGLADARISEDDHLEQHLLPRGHFWI